MEPQNKFTTPVTKNKKVTTLAIVSAVVLILAIAMTSLAAYFWQQERYTAESLRERLSELETSGATPAAPEAAGRLCENSTAQLTANVGRFTLNLPESNYVIIKNHDGAGEGGNSSRVSVGECLNGANNTVEYATDKEVAIYAVPASNWEGTSFDEWVTGRVTEAGGESRELDATTVAEVEAREFAIQGLGETRTLFFENNGIWYELSAFNATEGSPALTTRNAVVEGFSFAE